MTKTLEPTRVGGLSSAFAVHVFVSRVAELGLGVMRPALIILLLVLALAQSGCRYSLRKYNTPSQEKLQVQAAAVSNCVIRVVGADNTASFSPAADGRVVLDIPRLPRGCDIYFLGFIKIEDGGPENVSAIHVLRNDKVVRELSLVKLRKLPADAEGYHVLVLR